MKILYDHQMFSIQKYGGVTKYFCELIKNISSEHEYNLSLLLSENHYLKEDSSFFKKNIIPLPGKQFTGKGFLKRKLYYLNKQYSRRTISANKYDLFHPTFYDNYFFDVLQKPYVITVHDLMVFKFKNTYFKEDPYRHLMEKVIRNANRIISISQNTKKDIIDIFNINPEKIDVIYHGYTIPDIKKGGDNYGRYLLFVGRRNSYKNFITFINSISSLLNKDRGLKLICVGEPFSKEEMVELSKLDILKQTTALTVDEDSLNSLYANALVFVFPSLYEGFGMPILEAFANNCPVCLSNTSCFPEIAGKAGVYFDPYNRESISEAVNKVLNDNTCKNQMVSEGKKRLEGFSWHKTAMETLNTYKKALYPPYAKAVV